MSEAPSPNAAVDELIVACLCAAWCRTCDGYKATLAGVREAVARHRPGAALRVMWVDIEDEADTIGDLDIEDFPTLLLARAGRVQFFGPVLPHAQTVERLVLGALDGALPAPAAPAPEIAALPAVLAAHPTL